MTPVETAPKKGAPKKIVPEKITPEEIIPEQINSEKIDLRSAAAKNRARLIELTPDAAGIIAGFADDLIARCGAGIYAGYLPIKTELSPLPLIETLAQRGMVTAMPITPAPENPLSFHQWAPGMPLEDGPYKTKQPPADSELVYPDVVLAPMLAFDRACWRLGYGGGFYDRSIAALRDAGRNVVIIGVAYSGQQVEKVPVGPFDMALDGVLTENGLIWRSA